MAESDRRYRLSIEHPFLAPLVLLAIALVLRLVDVFVLRLDERLGEIILSKTLGFLLVLAYLWLLGRSVRDIGLHRRFLGKALFISGVGVGLIFAVAYLVEIIRLVAAGVQPSLVVTAIDPKTGLAGGVLFALFLVLGNVINSFMEEGLFRGVMLRHFMVRLSFWGANLLQALLFAAWHLVWPAKSLLDGDTSIAGAAAQAGMLLSGTLVGGVVYGYLYYRTDSLWAPWLAHTINNTVLNLLHVQSGDGQLSMASAVVISIMIPFGYLLLLPWTRALARRFRMPQVQPWGSGA